MGSGVRALPLSAEHAAGIAALPDDLDRHDPFDRLLLAQARTERIVLLTAERRLLALEDDDIVDARR